MATTVATTADYPDDKVTLPPAINHRPTRAYPPRPPRAAQECVVRGARPVVGRAPKSRFVCRRSVLSADMSAKREYLHTLDASACLQMKPTCLQMKRLCLQTRPQRREYANTPFSRTCLQTKRFVCRRAEVAFCLQTQRFVCRRGLSANGDQHIHWPKTPHRRGCISCFVERCFSQKRLRS